jgi:hypothetical protein
LRNLWLDVVWTQLWGRSSGYFGNSLSTSCAQ